jgi:hypothetical protein
MPRNKKELRELQKIRGLLRGLKTRDEWFKLMDYKKPTDDVKADQLRTEMWSEYIKTKDGAKDKTEYKNSCAEFRTWESWTFLKPLVNSRTT